MPGISEQLVLPKGSGFGIKDGALDKAAYRKIIPVLAAKVAPEKAGLVLKSPAMRRYVPLHCYTVQAHTK